MKKLKILREELERMRQLMGMNGSLYQKPIMGEGKGTPPGGKGGDPGKGKGKSPKAPEAGSPSPASPSPAVSDGSEDYQSYLASAGPAKPKLGSTAASAGVDKYVMPYGRGRRLGKKVGKRFQSRSTKKVNRAGKAASKIKGNKMKKVRKRRGDQGNFSE